MTADPDRDDLRDTPPDERRDDLPEALVALRERVEGHHPSAALKDAVLRDLPDREARRPWAPRRLGARARVALGLAAAAALIAPTFLLRRDGDRASRPLAIGWTPLAPDAPATIAAARERNLEAYAREKARLHRDLVGKWVVIAERDPATVSGAYKPIVVGETLDDVAAIGADLPHRFVFRVGEDGDEDVFVSSWYAPRFAGHGIATALGMQVVMHGAVDVSKDGRSASFRGPTPFPRVAFHLAAPDGTASPRNGDATPEVFIGSVGPDLMLTPQDATELRLARWEVPGTVTVGGVPCRRVRVTASVPAVGASGSVVACVPDVPMETLVEASRARHRFWEWSEGLRADLALDREPLGSPLVEIGRHERWIVFGNDRVLGRGTTAQEALDAAHAFRDVVYHRYVTRWPMPTPAPESMWNLDAVVQVGAGGARWAARVASLPADPSAGVELFRKGPRERSVFVARLTEAEWTAAGLTQAEEAAAPVVLSDRERPMPRPASEDGGVLRAAWADVRVWSKDAPDQVHSVFTRIVAYVVPR